MPLSQVDAITADPSSTRSNRVPRFCVECAFDFPQALPAPARLPQQVDALRTPETAPHDRCRALSVLDFRVSSAALGACVSRAVRGNRDLSEARLALAETLLLCSCDGGLVCGAALENFDCLLEGLLLRRTTLLTVIEILCDEIASRLYFLQIGLSGKLARDLLLQLLLFLLQLRPLLGQRRIELCQGLHEFRLFFLEIGHRVLVIMLSL